MSTQSDPSRSASSFRPMSDPYRSATASAPRYCHTVGHEDILAAFVGTFVMDDEVTPDVAYCKPCAALSIGCFEPTASLDSATLPVPHIECPNCGASIRATMSESPAGVRGETGEEQT